MSLEYLDKVIAFHKKLDYTPKEIYLYGVESDFEPILSFLKLNGANVCLLPKEERSPLSEEYNLTELNYNGICFRLVFLDYEIKLNPKD